ncbi:MAG TPA: hypothetical protein VGE52_20990, partial [Pirellulales bacterium]
MSQPNDPRRADDLTETSDSPERLRALEAAAPQPPDAGQSARKMPPFVVRVLLAGLALTALGLWWLIWGAGPNLPQQTLVAQRGSDGAFPESTGTASGLSGRLSAREANKSTSTISSQSSGGEARLRARSAVVYVATPDLLAQRVAHELFKELQKSSRFDSLTYHPPGEKFTQGELLPDLYLSVGVKSLKESGVAPYKTLEAEVQVTLGNLPARSSHSYMDTLSPPVVNHHWNSTINYSAREVGLETASARYEAVGRDLAADVAKSINEYLAKLAEKHGEWREDPLEFFPAFAPGPELPILQTLHAEKITSGHGFLTKNVTVWKTTLPRAEPDVVKRIAQDLESAGWKDATKRIEANDGYLRVEKEWQSQIFEVFRPSEFQPQEDEKADPREWYCVYTHRMTQTEASAALAKLFDRAAPESMLVPFSQWWYLDEERVAKYFAEHPPKLSG